ncbi:MAG: hypothetical protein QW474_01600 [Candidatus Aenigmatarchaeota archaeon]
MKIIVVFNNEKYELELVERVSRAGNKMLAGQKKFNNKKVMVYIVELNETKTQILRDLSKLPISELKNLYEATKKVNVVE